MIESGIDLREFKGRQEALEKIPRFYDKYWDVMFYRTTVGFHSRRVLWLLDDILEHIREVHPRFDDSFARILALVHDDLEIITGDVQLYRKESMTDIERRVLNDAETTAINQLATRWPKKINRYEYQELLLAAKEKKRVEAKVVSYCDKLDGLGESLHEVFAGNGKFMRPANNYARRRIPALVEEFPEIALLYGSKHPLLSNITIPDLAEVARQGKPHTRESLQVPTDISFYERWKAVTITRAGIGPLVEQKEYGKFRQKDRNDE